MWNEWDSESLCTCQLKAAAWIWEKRTEMGEMPSHDCGSDAPMGWSNSSCAVQTHIAVLMTEKASPLKQSLSSQHLNSLQMPRCSYCCTGTIPANPAYSGRIRPPALPCPGEISNKVGGESQHSPDFTDQPSSHPHSVVPLGQLQWFFTWKSNAKYFK